MKIAIGSDFAGYKLKEVIKEYLIKNEYIVSDLGQTEENAMVPYYEVASRVARNVQSGEYNKGILICGTGAGMCIVANKYKGIYALAVEGLYTARKAAIINNANILTFGQRVVGSGKACEMVKAWLETKFLEDFPEERHQFLIDSLDEVKSIENKNFD